MASKKRVPSSSNPPLITPNRVTKRTDSSRATAPRANWDLPLGEFVAQANTGGLTRRNDRPGQQYPQLQQYEPSMPTLQQPSAGFQQLGRSSPLHRQSTGAYQSDVPLDRFSMADNVGQPPHLDFDNTGFYELGTTLITDETFPNNISYGLPLNTYSLGMNSNAFSTNPLMRSQFDTGYGGYSNPNLNMLAQAPQGDAYPMMMSTTAPQYPVQQFSSQAAQLQGYGGPGSDPLALYGQVRPQTPTRNVQSNTLSFPPVNPQPRMSSQASTAARTPPPQSRGSPMNANKAAAEAVAKEPRKIELPFAGSVPNPTKTLRDMYAHHAEYQVNQQGTCYYRCFLCSAANAGNSGKQTANPWLESADGSVPEALVLHSVTDHWKSNGRSGASPSHTMYCQFPLCGQDKIKKIKPGQHPNRSTYTRPNDYSRHLRQAHIKDEGDYYCKEPIRDPQGNLVVYPGTNETKLCDYRSPRSDLVKSHKKRPNVHIESKGKGLIAH